MSILITGTTESVQVVLDATPATNQLPLSASYADQGGLGGDHTINSNGTTAVTLVASPAASVSRVINSILIPNADTATRTVTVNKVISGTPFRLAKITLLAGYMLAYGSGRWYVLDPSGNFLENVTVNSGSLTANQGAAAALSGAWPVKVTDGTNVLGTAAQPLRINPTGTTAQPVTGTFWQATQPVSGAVSVSNFPATQPVSGTVTANQGTNPWVTNVIQGTGFSTQNVQTAGTLHFGSSATKYLTGILVTYQIYTAATTITVVIKDGAGNTIYTLTSGAVATALTVYNYIALYFLAVPLVNAGNVPSIVTTNSATSGVISLTIIYA